MYGKHYESMYEGSMYGAGLAVFAVWGYVIAHTRESRVELNPRKLADTLGGGIDEIADALVFLMEADPESRHKEHEGRRLVKEGEYQYFVPSWGEYQRMRDEADRREYNRQAKRRERERKRKVGGGKPLPGEVAALGAEARGDAAGAEAIAGASVRGPGGAAVAEGKAELAGPSARGGVGREGALEGGLEPAAKSVGVGLKGVGGDANAPAEAAEVAADAAQAPSGEGVGKAAEAGQGEPDGKEPSGGAPADEIEDAQEAGELEEAVEDGAEDAGGRLIGD